MKYLFICLMFFSLIPEQQNEIEKINLKVSENEMAFTFFDLIDGESTLILDEEGHTILVNTGSIESEEELGHYLTTYGIENIDFLILTSDKEEYIGNSNWLLSSYEIKEIFLPESLKNTWDEVNLRIRFLEAGQTLELLKGLSITVLSDEINNHTGMDLLFRFGKNELLFMTSADKNVEKDIMERYEIKNVHVLKVGDFGYENGTHDNFLKSTDPQVAILFKRGNVVLKPDVLERLQETWIDIYQTKQVGNVTIKLTKNNYQVFTIPLRTNVMFSKTHP